MTYSICCTNGRVHGVAIATKAPAVGAIAPFLSKNGAVSTQSLANVSLGAKAARLMDNESSVDDAVHTLLEKDSDAAVRQVHGVDRWGNTITYSGEECVEWFGETEGENYTVAGNMLVGDRVVEAIADTYTSNTDKELADRLISCIEAGEEAGGDKRAENAQSAAVKIYHPDEPRLFHDLRVDDHEDPVSEVRRVYNVAKDDDEDWQEEFPETILQRYP